MKKIVAGIAGLLLGVSLFGQGPQLYNMGFDTWSKKGGIWYLYGKDDPAARRVWDSANPGLGQVRLPY